MLGKGILAGIFAVVILFKLITLIINPNLWIRAVEVFLGYDAPVIFLYLVLILITGYYLFSTLDLLDIAVAMFFTSLLIAIGILPYATALLKLREEISIGVSKAWLAAAIWGALAAAVLFKVFSPGRTQVPKE